MEVMSPVRGRPRGDVTRQRVGVMLHPDLLAQARALSVAERRSVSAMLEILVERGLRAYGLELSA